MNVYSPSPHHHHHHHHHHSPPAFVSVFARICASVFVSGNEESVLLLLPTQHVQWLSSFKFHYEFNIKEKF